MDTGTKRGFRSVTAFWPLGAGLAVLAYWLFSSAGAVPGFVLSALPGDYRGDISVQGGTHARYQIAGAEASAQEATQIISTLRRRGAKNISQKGGVIALDWPGIKSDDVRLGRTNVDGEGTLDFHMVIESSPMLAKLYVEAKEHPAAARHRVDIYQHVRQHQRSGQVFNAVTISAQSAVALKAFFAELFTARPELSPPPEKMFVIEEWSEEPTSAYAFLVDKTPVISRDDFVNAMISFDVVTHAPVVVVTMSEQAQARWADVTRDSVGRRFAIVFNGRAMSTPTIAEPILGGSSQIEFDNIAEAEALQGALSQPRLARPLELLSTEPVEASVSASKLAMAHAILSGFVGVALVVLLWLVSRFSRSNQRAVITHHRAEPMVRLLVTAVGVAAAVFATKVPLPFIKLSEILPIPGARAQLSVFTLGITPVISAFILVEIVAYVVPPWNRLRTSGPEGRVKLGLAVLVVAALLSLTQAYVLAKQLVSLHGVGFEAIVSDAAPWPVFVLTILAAAGVFVLVLLAEFINRYGLGNGYIWLLAGGFIQFSKDFLSGFRDFATTSDIFWLLAAITVPAVVVYGLLRARLRYNDGVVELPTSGILPLQWTMWPALTGTLLFASGVIEYESFVYLAKLFDTNTGLWLLGVAVLSVSLSFVFSFPRQNSNLDVRRAFYNSVAVTTVSLVLLGVFGAMAPIPERWPQFTMIAIVVAALMDTASEYRARCGSGDLVAVWPLYSIKDLGFYETALRDAKIPVFAKGLYARKLFYFFAPFVPVLLVVPREHGIRAQEIAQDVCNNLEKSG